MKHELSSRLATLIRDGEIPLSDAWGKLLDDIAKVESALLAAHEQEPVAFVKSGYALCYFRPPQEYGLKIGDKLFRHPAPSIPAVVPKEIPDSVYQVIYQECGGFVDCEANALTIWDACRAAMLNHPSNNQASHAAAVGGEIKQPSSNDCWIPVSERLPELDIRVLLYFANCGGHIEDGCIGDEGEGPYHYFFDGDSLISEPTHWMPLPAPPKQ